MIVNKEKAYALLKVVWPTIYRGINNFFFFLYTVIRGGIRIAIEQLKGTF